MTREIIPEEKNLMFQLPGPGPETPPKGTIFERPPLTLPKEHSAFIDQQMATGRFFGKRFPSIKEFREFLEANREWTFNERSFYECSMSGCAGGPVSEGMSTDVDINAPTWFRAFENLTQAKDMWTGAQLLPLLDRLEG